MYRAILLFWLVFFQLNINAWAQDNQEKLRYVISPNDTYLLTIASQPDCPVQVEKARLLLAVGRGNFGASYRLRNVGNKPIKIRSITLSLRTALGVGSGWQQLTQDAEKLVAPGELIKTREDYPKPEVIPLTEEVRRMMKLLGPLRAVVVLMIERIEFSDGSVYSEERSGRELQSYFEKIEFVEP